MLLYAAFGDSLTAGVGAFPGAGLVQSYRELAEEALNRQIQAVNLGVSGATAGELLNLAGGSRQIRELLGEADIITLTAGGNDLIRAAKQYARTREQAVLQEALVRCRSDYARLLELIRSLQQEGSRSRSYRRSRRYIIRAADLYNPLPDVPEGAPWVQRFNRQIDDLSGGPVRVAHLYSAFQGREQELLSYDRVHPNARGYQVIARRLHRLGYGPLG